MATAYVPQKSITDAPFYRKITAYKELIAVVLFFVGMAGWVYNTFATKCIMEASLESQRLELAQRSHLVEISDKRLEMTILESLQTAAIKLSDEQVRQLNTLKSEYEKLAETDNSQYEAIGSTWKKCTIF